MIIEPIGYVGESRTTLDDDRWGGTQCRIDLVQGLSAASLEGLSEFSHLEILYQFHLVDDGAIVTGARHPRGNPAWPMVGIFAQRAKARPNRIGATMVRLVSCEGTRLIVAGLDAVDGTPVIDIKPVMQEFLPREAIRQPRWSHELMREYWDGGAPG